MIQQDRELSVLRTRLQSPQDPDLQSRLEQFLGSSDHPPGASEAPGDVSEHVGTGHVSELATEATSDGWLLSDDNLAFDPRDDVDRPSAPLLGGTKRVVPSESTFE